MEEKVLSFEEIREMVKTHTVLKSLLDLIEKNSALEKQNSEKLVQLNADMVKLRDSLDTLNTTLGKLDKLIALADQVEKISKDNLVLKTTNKRYMETIQKYEAIEKKIAPEPITVKPVQNDKKEFIDMTIEEKAAFFYKQRKTIGRTFVRGKSEVASYFKITLEEGQQIINILRAQRLLINTTLQF